MFLNNSDFVRRYKWIGFSRGRAVLLGNDPHPRERVQPKPCASPDGPHLKPKAAAREKRSSPAKQVRRKPGPLGEMAEKLNDLHDSPVLRATHAEALRVEILEILKGIKDEILDELHPMDRATILDNPEHEKIVQQWADDLIQPDSTQREIRFDSYLDLHVKGRMRRSLLRLACARGW
jgi:hypothetical protein